MRNERPERPMKVTEVVDRYGTVVRERSSEDGNPIRDPRVPHLEDGTIDFSAFRQDDDDNSNRFDDPTSDWWLWTEGVSREAYVVGHAWPYGSLPADSPTIP